MAKGLGKGLEGLFEDNFESTPSADGRTTLRLTDIEPDRNQPRKNFRKEPLEELSQSIAEHGVLQAITVRPISDGRYRIVSGERRWRAAHLAGLTEIPAVIREMTDSEALEIGLIENLQREDLNAVEEALGYRELSDSFGLTQQDISKRVGKSRPAVANAMRILSLPDEVLELVKTDKLSAGHARALLPLCERLSPEAVTEKANEIVNKGLTVRDAENMAKAKRPLKRTRDSKEDIYYKEIAEALSSKWGRKVEIKVDKAKKAKGTVVFEFYGADDFEELTEKLK